MSTSSSSPSAVNIRETFCEKCTKIVAITSEQGKVRCNVCRNEITPCIGCYKCKEMKALIRKISIPPIKTCKGIVDHRWVCDDCLQSEVIKNT